MRLAEPVRNLLSILTLSTALLVACAPAVPAATPTPVGQPVTSADQIVGVWQTFNPHCAPGYMLIRPDGTYTWACSQDGTNQSLTGRYSLDGSRMLIANDLCQGGQFDVRLVPASGGSKSLAFTLVKDDCSGEVDIMTKQPVLWVSPLP